MNSEVHTDSHTHAKTLVERLFGVGAHFGFAKSRRHPSITPYIFGNKLGADIIDLEKTASLLEDAKTVMHEAGRSGKVVMFVGTKKEITSTVEQFAKSINMPFVTNRWVGGILTNFSEIKKRVFRLNDLIAQGESGELERKYTKKERVIIGRELNKLTLNFSGIQKMERLPQLVVIADPRHDHIAVRETRELNIPTIAVAGSDTNVHEITHPVVANDALQVSVSFILDELVRAYESGKSEYIPPPKREEPRRFNR